MLVLEESPKISSKSSKMGALDFGVTLVVFVSVEAAGAFFSASFGGSDLGVGALEVFAAGAGESPNMSSKSSNDVSIFFGGAVLVG